MCLILDTHLIVHVSCTHIWLDVNARTSAIFLAPTGAQGEAMSVHVCVCVCVIMLSRQGLKTALSSSL